ncbi:MAG: hypothetical protein AAGF36_05125 [Pseudomonadota bacterium]
MALAACGDPLGDIARVSQGEPLPTDPGASIRPSNAELARQDPILTELLRQDSTVDADALAQGPTASESIAVNATVPETQAETSTPDTERAPSRGGVLGWLRQAAQNRDATRPLVVPAALPNTSDGTLAASPVTATPDLVDPEKRRGLFDRSPARSGAGLGLDTADVTPGTLLPFGQIARNCAAQPAREGKVVDKAARKGRGYALYDTAPDSSTPRTFYVTGFADNCPRQFTAALALFGDPAFHEQLRYGLPAEEYPYSTTDKAYEKLKRRICNVGRNTPCGDRIDRLSRNTTFISAYENFTDNARWADMLLHDGAVLATALKTP